MATALFIGHIIFTKGNVWIARSLAAASIVWAVGSIIALAVSGYEHWQTVSNDSRLVCAAFLITPNNTTIANHTLQHNAWMGVEISGLVLEVGLWISSCHLLWGLQMQLRRRLFILAAFGTRLL